MAGDGKGCSWTPGILWGVFGGSCVGSCTTLGLVGKCVPKHGFADSVCYRGSQAATGVDSTVRIAQSRVLSTGQVDAYCVAVTLTPDSCGNYTSSPSCRGTSGCAWTALLPDSLLPNDSCERKDGRCDEPLLCSRGTDSTDCGLPGTCSTASNNLGATLVWSDPPPSPFAERTLVNDLDLDMIGPGGAVYYGNHRFSKDETHTRAYRDMYNNAERIRVPLIATGGSTSTEFFLIRVKGNDVPHWWNVAGQKYALVISAPP